MWSRGDGERHVQAIPAAEQHRHRQVHHGVAGKQGAGDAHPAQIADLVLGVEADQASDPGVEGVVGLERLLELARDPQRRPAVGAAAQRIPGGGRRHHEEHRRPRPRLR
jgi:hypothetical protein